ncbi:hypothetical protein ASE82_04670 [Sphingomonas sp. Leaf230]|nr:hypothetical protein ASE82_04670 [Sphingomonas sp. Leaf230]
MDDQFLLADDAILAEPAVQLNAVLLGNGLERTAEPVWHDRIDHVIIDRKARNTLADRLNHASSVGQRHSACLHTERQPALQNSKITKI